MTTQDTRLSVIWKFFGKAPVNEFRPKEGTISTFRDEWKRLTETDKTELQEGITNGTLTY